MTKNILRHTLTALGLVWMFVAEAQHLSFNPTTKFRIESKVSFGSAMALGSNHGINSPVCIDINRSTSNDRYWYIYEFKTGKYAFRNASTGQYLVYDGVRSNSPIRRNLSLTNNVANDSALWTIGQSPAGYYYVQSVVAPTYCFNVRTGSYVLGTFNEGGTPNNNNELFSIYKEDGTPYDPQKDYNTVCGRNDDGLYWAISDLEHPFVFTTDDSDPVYYYIKNSRSTLWIEPDQFLKQSADKPSKRFYFKEAKDGVQIMIEGGGFVSAELPQSNQTSATDVQTQSGRPNANDHIWNIAYHSNNGYSVGIEKCSKNSTYNPKIIGGQVYWNDYSQFGVCYYSVDEGSLFQFYSDDERHRNYLAGLGLVIPSDSIITPDKPDDPPVDPVTDGLESITGTLTHVYRADGKIDVIPAQYVANITRADSVIITTKNNGPRYAYASYEVDSVSACVPQDLPRFNSFKFNNKFNQHLISDAIGVFYGDSLITLNAVCIGKRLRPSFQVDDDVEVYVGDSLQLSKTTRTRYDHDVTYTIARHGQTVLRRTTKGKYVVYPYGRKTRVHVDFATDQATGDYGVPVIYINTDDGTAVNSKEYYWNAKMSIDGAGVFEDMPETAMQIKGRGNSSWTPTGKAPYHIKFETAVKPFGLRKGKHWNLIANAQSLSMTTNAIAMKMAQLVETAGFNHEIPCELYLNGQYRGSYNLTEKIGFSNNSIDIVDETNAVMLELDSYYDEVYKFRTQRYSLPVNIKEPDLTLGTSPLTSLLINQHFNRAITAMYNKGDMSQYFDLDYLARFLFVDEYAFNTEFMHPKSTFLYNENILNSDCKYIFGPVWDFDWGYGYQLRGNYFSIQPTLDFWSSVNMTATSWVRDLRYCGTNLDKEYYRLWHNFMTNGSLDELVEFCQDYYDFAKASFTHNNVRWGGGDANSYAALTSNAQTWLRSRAQYIYDYLSKGLGYANLGYLDNYPAPNLIGDVNNDGDITTADIICVLNYMLRLPNEEFKYKNADIDENNMITIGDAVSIFDMLGEQPVQSGRFYRLPVAEATIVTDIASHTPTGVSVPLTISVQDGNYSGIQFDVLIPKGMTIEDLDISNAIPEFDINIAETGGAQSADNDRYRISIYSAGNNLLPQGESKLELLLGWGYGEKASGVLAATLSNVMFVTTQGEDERSASRSSQFTNEELTGLNSAVSLAGQEGNQLFLSSSQNTVLPVYGVDGRIFRLYDINTGRQTITLPRGIYIINKQKITVK